MTHRSRPSPAQRIGVLLSVLALHAALLIVFLAISSAALPPIKKSGVLSLISINADVSAQRPPPPPKLPSKVLDQIKLLTEQALSFDPDSSALAAPSGACATLDVVMKAIVADPAAVAAVNNAPPETRSIAEAIVIWNAGWSYAASAPDSPLSPARAIVEQSLDSVDDGCLDEPIAGPRLVPVPDGDRTMFLVFGSGIWTWRELVTDLESAQAGAAIARVPKAWYDLDWF